ncbi:MAG: sigma-70 family RNA polymerase sigma factor, partial [Ilumatobacteraceae bacterium]
GGPARNQPPAGFPPPTPATVGGSGHFSTLPPGSVLPADADCAAAVRPKGEIRPANGPFNQTRGAPTAGQGGLYGRITGNFTGTTDEIIQWAACKWGIDEDIVRAQVAKESWWFQRTGGDFTTDRTRCVPGHPIGADGQPGQCPESIGLMQLRYPYWGFAFPSAATSSSYNLDSALAARRNCFEGYDTWFNDVPRGRQYAAGDIWGCVGAWFSGRWYTDGAGDYIAAVQDYLNRRVWESPDFANAT